MYQRINKQWVYTCTLCDYSTSAPDQLRIVEAKNRHLRGNLTHFANAVTAAFKPMADAIERMVKVMTDTSAQMQSSYTLMPPPNVPHDPSLRADKRKWGGK